MTTFYVEKLMQLFIQENEMFVQDMIKKFDIPSVNSYDYSDHSLDSFLKKVRVDLGIEGYILVMKDGHRYKVKAEDYVLKHRARDAVAKKRHIWTMILDGTLDDFIPLLNDADKAIVDETEKEFWKLWQQVNWVIDAYTFNVVVQYSSKKDYAMNGDKDSVLRQFAFARYDNKDLTELLNNHIRKHLNQDSKQAEIQAWMESFL